MKKALTVFLLLLWCNAWLYGQIPPVKQKFAIVTVKQPLVYVGSFETNYQSLIIDRDNLKTIKVYRDSAELVPFREKGRNGIILTELKNKTPLLRLDEVLDYFKVAAADRTARVLVNKSPVNPNLFLADVTRIKRIEKTKQDPTSIMRYSFNPDEEFLNIVTLDE